MAVIEVNGSAMSGGSVAGAAGPPHAILNAMTVDVEDYFQVSALAHAVDPADWDRLESRVCRNTERLLEIFEAADVKATFFVLGWVAERHPALVRRIAGAGHELASHGYAHQVLDSMTPEQFRKDLQRARIALESASGMPIVGYRAPSFSITRRTMWALDVLVDEGYLFDGSIFPVYHDRYGVPDWPRRIHLVQRARGVIWELPTATVRRAGTNLPVGGGGYFRLLPYRWTRWGIAHLNAAEREPAIFYLHPWEIDPDQPRFAVTGLSRLRHYANLRRTEARLTRLLREFSFGTVSAVLAGRMATAPVLRTLMPDISPAVASRV